MDKKDMIKIINSMAGKYSTYEVFNDWIKCCSLAISNSCQMVHDRVWREREQIYLDTIKKYSKEEINKFCELLAMLTETLDESPADVLGTIYMELGIGSKAAGQHFTPYHLSLACARLAIMEKSEDGYYWINEPSCGGGGMIIAATAVLKERGINYQKEMRVVAQDLDWKGVYMCYLQLSLLGINAICVQGDTLAEPYTAGYPPERTLYTPVKRGLVPW